MIQGFKEFIMRGNVIELAIAVVIGTAFTNIVTAFTENLVNPLIASFGSVDASGLGFAIRQGNEATFLDFGAVITAAINFLIIALVVYLLLVVPMNKLDELNKKRLGVDPEEPTPTSEELLAEIRDMMANQQNPGTPKHLG